MKSKSSVSRESGKTKNCGSISSKAAKHQFEKDMSQSNAWKCTTCGHVYKGDEPPDECPYCVFPNKSFE